MLSLFAGAKTAASGSLSLFYGRGADLLEHHDTGKGDNKRHGQVEEQVADQRVESPVVERKIYLVDEKALL